MNGWFLQLEAPIVRWKNVLLSLVSMSIPSFDSFLFSFRAIIMESVLYSRRSWSAVISKHDSSVVDESPESNSVWVICLFSISMRFTYLVWWHTMKFSDRDAYHDKCYKQYPQNCNQYLENKLFFRLKNCVILCESYFFIHWSHSLSDDCITWISVFSHIDLTPSPLTGLGCIVSVRGCRVLPFLDLHWFEDRSL